MGRESAIKPHLGPADKDQGVLCPHAQGVDNTGTSKENGSRIHRRARDRAGSRSRAHLQEHALPPRAEFPRQGARPPVGQLITPRHRPGHQARVGGPLPRPKGDPRPPGRGVR